MSSAQFALTAALFAAGLLLAAGPGHRLGLWPHRVGLALVLGAGTTALVALAAAGQTLARAAEFDVMPWGAAWAAAIALVAVAIPASWTLRALSTPWINDVTTDTHDPPPLDRETTPTGDETLAPLTLDLPMSQAIEVTRRTATALGWKVSAHPSSSDLVAATVTTPWFGFTDDVVVRVRALGSGRARVDVRSASRVGISDIGTNARRMRRLLKRLRAAAGRELRGGGR